MSFCFHVKALTPPLVEDVLSGTGLADLSALEETPAGAAWPEGTLHLHRPGLSTRGVEVTLEAGSFEVRLLSFMSPEDVDAAFRIIEGLSEAGGGLVEAEGGEAPFPAAELRARYPKAWSRRLLASACETLRTMVSEGRKVGVEGPVRPVHFGPAVVSRLEKAGPANGFPSRVLALLRRVQYIEAEGYQVPDALEAKSRDGGLTVTLTVWRDGRRSLLPVVEYVVLGDSEACSEMACVPYDALPALAEGLCRPLDEAQLLVDDVPAGEWESLVERARRHGSKPRLGA